MKYCNDYLINGAPLLVPDGEVALAAADLDAADAGRDESGVMHRIRVRKRVKTWGFKYFALRAEQYAYLHTLLAEHGTFTFTYPLPDGTPATCRAYCSNDSITYCDSRLGLYRNYHFNIIEC